VRARRAHPYLEPGARTHGGPGHSRAREHFQDRQTVHHARPGKSKHHRLGEPPKASRREHRPPCPRVLQPLEEGDVMATPSNYWKLGLFVVAGVVLALSTVVVLGARQLRKETIKYKSYFDESVQGLKEDSPVKFRGVTIGHVSDIGIAPDHRMVEVTSELT